MFFETGWPGFFHNAEFSWELFLYYCPSVWRSHPSVACFNTLRPRQNGRHFPDDIFKWIFLNENIWISIDISLKFVSKDPINNIPTLVQVMAWRRPGDKPLSEPMMVRLPMHICVTRPQWVNIKPIFPSAGTQYWKLTSINRKYFQPINRFRIGNSSLLLRVCATVLPKVVVPFWWQLYYQDAGSSCFSKQWLVAKLLVPLLLADVSSFRDILITNLNKMKKTIVQTNNIIDWWVKEHALIEKLATVCRNFQFHFLVWKWLNFDSTLLKDVPWGPFNN